MVYTKPKRNLKQVCYFYELEIGSKKEEAGDFKKLQQIGNIGFVRNLASNRSMVVYSNQKEIWSKYVFATKPDSERNKFLLFKKFITNMKKRVWSQLFIQSISGGVY